MDPSGHEHEPYYTTITDGPAPIYWSITLKVGDEPEQARGGTASSHEQAREQAAFWLRDMADRA